MESFTEGLENLAGLLKNEGIFENPKAMEQLVNKIWEKRVEFGLDSNEAKG